MELMRDEVERAATENADVAIDTMTRNEIQAFIGETLRDSLQGDPTGIKYSVASRAQRAADFTDQVIEFLKRYFKGDIEPKGDSRYDALLLIGEQRVAVDIRWSLTATSFQTIVDHAYSNDFDILMVLAYKLPSDFNESFRNALNTLAPPNIIVAEYDAVLVKRIAHHLSNPTETTGPLVNVYSSFAL
jgi:hypothetical protein